MGYLLHENFLFLRQKVVLLDEFGVLAVVLSEQLLLVLLLEVSDSLLLYLSLA